ncbi:MAG: bile acid:sodium symporter family protein [Verrucomicrobiae bacterium]|nr:bile acid:sodium symporter family protein [Verrucomicrobiae bacterium]
MPRCLAIAANAFPLWVLLGGLLALWHPPWFVWFRPFIVPGLAVIMLGMGLTLRVSDFRRALRMPRTVAVGLAAQFTVMPLLGWTLAHTLQLERDFAVGLILVACCPGGTASNVVTYLARANVALSVLMTMASTFGAILMTPLLTRSLAGTLVPVPALKLFLDTVQVVLLPVLAGIALHHRFPRLTRAVLPAAPIVSVLTIAMICAAIIGLNAGSLRNSGGRLLLAVSLLHAGGFALGYVVGRLARYDTLVRRTLSIEVGMQNSGLGVVLADNFRNPVTGIALAAVPCAISATVHSVLGSLLAGLWRLRPPPRPPA